MRRRLEFHDEQHKGQANEDQAGIVDRHHAQRVKGQQQAENPDNARHVSAGAG
ncbi:MAG: hypothetical protein GWN58_65400 [Anaerolineae bacterium]|nr:hypothetical protein [Anaerolineae bacterium]